MVNVTIGVPDPRVCDVDGIPLPNTSDARRADRQRRPRVSRAPGSAVASRHRRLRPALHISAHDPGVVESTSLGVVRARLLRHALAEGVALVAVRAVLLAERVPVLLALGLAGRGGGDVGVDLVGDGAGGRRLGGLRHALAVSIALVLAGAVLLGERGRVGGLLGLARLRRVLGGLVAGVLRRALALGDTLAERVV